MTHPTLERVGELFDIDPDSGAIKWKKSQGRRRAGDAAGRIHPNGYHLVCIDGREVGVHTLVWFVMTGDWPSLIDHINGARSDNRFSNLREADRASNARNRTNWVHAKLLGAHKTPSGAYRAAITADGAEYHLGTFPTERAAHERYLEARLACAEAEKRARLMVLEEMQVQKVAA